MTTTVEVTASPSNGLEAVVEVRDGESIASTQVLNRGDKTTVYVYGNQERTVKVFERKKE